MTNPTSGLGTYTPKTYPVTPGGESKFHTGELQSISDTIKKLTQAVQAQASAPIALTSLAPQAAGTILGNITGGPASAVALTETQVTANLNPFTTALKGLVPAPGTSTGKFLRDDATWATVSLAGLLLNTNNLSDVSSAATSRTNLGLGSAALLTAGTAASNAVQLDGSAHLPAVDGSALTNLPAQTGRLVAGTALVVSPYVNSTATTQAHGLGVAPVHILARLTCLTANAGYSIGDVIALGSFTSYFSVAQDATNIILITSNSSPQVMNKSTGVFTTITLADWSITLTPYKLT